MIYVTGDVHGEYDFDKLPAFAAEHPELTRRDYVIVAGDFGIWDATAIRYGLKRHEALPFTLLFVDGNHEHFDALNALPVETWHGGKVHRLKENVLHLMRGQVFDIEGKTFFTFGGATSNDKDQRVEGEDWFPAEVPSDADIVEANRNLARVGFKVNFIVTHSCDERTLYYPAIRYARSFFVVRPENGILSYFDEQVSYDHWYFGHFHTDCDLTEKKSVLYERILRVV